MATVDSDTGEPAARVPMRGSRTRAPSLDGILDVAARLFAEVGYQNVTMQDLADAIGIAKPTLYVHARSKTAILEGIFERVTREAESAVDAAAAVPVPRDRLRHLLIEWSRMAIKIQAYYSVYFVNTSDLPRPAARYFERWSAEMYHKVRTMVAEGQRVGAIRKDLDPTIVAFSVIALPNWTARWFNERAPYDADKIAEQQWELLARGLLND